MRDSMWGFLLFAGVAWLAIGWSVLRLEPADVAPVAGPVVLFGALCEAVRALAGTRTWWLNAGMALLFGATAAVLLLNRDATYATPASLIGWFLLVRGAMDVAVSTMNRGIDRTWGMMLAVGVAQAALGFYAAGPLARRSDPVILVLGGLGVLRAVADLVTALRLREVSVRHEVLHLTPEREAGVSGYSAGLADYEGTPPPAKAKHRADTPGPKTFHEEVLRSTMDLDAKIAQAGVTGTGTAARLPEDLPPVPDTPAGVEPARSLTEE
ncbi:hypothetical protein [Actinoplanes subtropicus]|uniref:hypothetical protein n=1 Tax=Actinoplanes subtropicus TaxID=543632 RepID=UPI0004C35E29|nr:hypothetical protein [Actinoplanes subtropicus]